MPYERYEGPRYQQPINANEMLQDKTHPFGDHKLELVDGSFTAAVVHQSGGLEPLIMTGEVSRTNGESIPKLAVQALSKAAGLHHDEVAHFSYERETDEITVVDLVDKNGTWWQGRNDTFPKAVLDILAAKQFQE